MKKIFLSSLTVFLLLAIILFFPWPVEERIINEKNYRNAHCLDPEQNIVLCPDGKVSFLRPDGGHWTLETNSYGERATQLTKKCDDNKKEIWLIGDSMSMGYLLDGRDTPAQQLENILNLPVRNIAVDALGTMGIYKIFLSALQNHSSDSGCFKIPVQVYWIWNTSDYSDDEKEITQNKNILKRMIYPIHTWIAKHSLIYIILKKANSENNRIQTNIAPSPHPKDHITYKNLKFIKEKFTEFKIPIVLAFGYGMRYDGKPETEDPNYKILPIYLKELGYETLDLGKSVEESFSKKEKIFIPKDGHPDRDYAKLFALKMAEHFKGKKQP